MVRHVCELPPVLEGCTRIDWPGKPDVGEPMTALLRLLKSRTDSMHPYLRDKDVRRAVSSARCAMGTDFNPGSTNEGQSLLAFLLTPDIQNLDEEGLALKGSWPQRRRCPSSTTPTATTSACCWVKS
jgi:hypothetical protein